MAKLKSSQVKASTLLEVIVSMVIILIVFTLAIGIYNNVLISSSSAKQVQIKTMTDHVVLQSISESNWKDQESTEDSIILQKIVLPYEKYTDLVTIVVTAFEHGKQVGQSRQVTKRSDHDH